MEHKKLSSGFLVTDLKTSPTAGGMVRLAPKILPSGAEQLARSATYLFAANKLQIGGASAGINAQPEARQASIADFIADISTNNKSETTFSPYPGKGVMDEDLAPLYKNTSTDMQATGLSAITAMDELLKTENSLGIEGKSVILEGVEKNTGFEKTTLGALAGIEKFGAKLTGISTAKTFLYNESGIDPKTAAETFIEHGDDFLDFLEGEKNPAKKVFNTSADVFLAGSKMGVIDHKIAEGLDISMLGSLHPIPYTTRALFILNEKGVVVPPDFLCLGGLVDPDDTETKTRALIQETKAIEPTMKAQMENIEPDKPALFLAGCKLVEDFLLTWQEELPFGRPLA